jgi:hypothetical protein
MRRADIASMEDLVFSFRPDIFEAHRSVKDRSVEGAVRRRRAIANFMTGSCRRSTKIAQKEAARNARHVSFDIQTLGR